MNKGKIIPIPVNLPKVKIGDKIYYVNREKLLIYNVDDLRDYEKFDCEESMDDYLSQPDVIEIK